MAVLGLEKQNCGIGFGKNKMAALGLKEQNGGIGFGKTFNGGIGLRKTKWRLLTLDLSSSRRPPLVSTNRRYLGYGKETKYELGAQPDSCQ